MSRESKIALAAIAVIVMVLAIARSVRDDEPDPEVTTPPESTSVVVIYEVEGDVPYASVTLTTPTGMEQIEPDVPMVTRAGDRGLTYQFPRGGFVSISAQKTADDGRGTITCRITVDGDVISENTSTAAFGIASCSGSVR